MKESKILDTHRISYNLGFILPKSFLISKIVQDKALVCNSWACKLSEMPKEYSTSLFLNSLNR